MNNPPSVPGVDLQDLLGRGAFGSVYKAHHRTLDLPVAVKIVDTSQIDEPKFLEYAVAEARLMARLDHPNLLRIYDAGQAEQSLYLTLELMDDTCDKTRHLSAERSIDFTLQLLAGLQALHEARIIHRDIKPANCLLRLRDQRVKLADLGIAVQQASRLSNIQAQDFAGTLAFMPPEAFDASPKFGPLSDLYALGLTLSCMILDSDPFPRTSRAALLGWIMNGPRPNVAGLRPDLPEDFSRLIERLMARDMEARPKSAQEALVSFTESIRLHLNSAESQGWTDESRTRYTIGSWIIDQPLKSTPNWDRFAVVHLTSGRPGRLSHVREQSSLVSSHETILGSAQRAAGLRHENIIEVIDWGMHQDRPWVVTAPQGQPLHKVVASQGPLAENEALRFALDIAEALVFLHANDLVYQTLDPGSVVLSGTARKAQLAWPFYCVPAGSPATDDDGTPVRIWVLKWAPPEVIFSPATGDINPSVDLYGLGEVLYFLLTGRSAFERYTGSSAVAFAKLRTTISVRESAPYVTLRTEDLVRSLLSGDSDKRPQTAGDVRDLIREILDATEKSSTPTTMLT